MPRMITNCADCGQRMEKIFENMTFNGPIPKFLCERCEKEKEITAKFSNIIGNTPSVAFLKRLKA